MANAPLSACCQEPANRQRTTIQGPLTVETCRVCQRRHFHLHIDLADVLGRPLSAPTEG